MSQFGGGIGNPIPTVDETRRINDIFNPCPKKILQHIPSIFYPELCVSTVHAAATAASLVIKSSKDLFLTAMNYTIYTVERNYFTIKKTAAGRSLTRREKTALHDCLEVINETLEELHESEIELKYYGFKNYFLAEHKENMETLPSAVQTNQDSCLDGFSHDEADEKVRKALIKGQMHVFRFVSNVLAIIKNLSDTKIAANNFPNSHFSVQVRKLGEDSQWPAWLSTRDRRLLKSSTVTPDMTMAADESGNYWTVSAAVATAPSSSSKSQEVCYRD